MKRMGIGVGVVALITLGVATPSAAQELQLGTWTGTLFPPDGTGVAVTYEVGQTDGTLSIVMSTAELGDMPFSDARLEGDELTFWWEPGTRVDCALQRREDGSFEGSCAAGNGEGAISMVPPPR
jgi:hypothetical protein